MMMEAETGMPMSPSVLAIIFCCRLLPSGGAGGTGGAAEVLSSLPDYHFHPY